MYKTDVAMLYGIVDIRTFNRRVKLSGLLEVMPQLGQKKALFFPKDMEIIQSHLGGCRNWESYKGGKQVA